MSSLCVTDFIIEMPCDRNEVISPSPGPFSADGSGGVAPGAGGSESHIDVAREAPVELGAVGSTMMKSSAGAEPPVPLPPLTLPLPEPATGLGEDRGMQNPKRH